MPTPSTPGYTSFRGRTCCTCLAAWLPVFEAELIRRGVIRESLDIAQLTGNAAASGNTHSQGGAFDIWQHDDVTVWVARQMGAPATWARTTGSFATNRHTHGVLSGCPHNGPAAYQIAEVWADGDGLLGDTPDPGPRPIPDRTWRQGIAWARQQQEDDMAQYADQLDRIEAAATKTVRMLERQRTLARVLATRIKTTVEKGHDVTESELEQLHTDLADLTSALEDDKD